MMNIIDAIDPINVMGRKNFLQKLYPNGLNDFILSEIGFNDDGLDCVTLALHTQIPPSVEVYQWGEWGENYNMVYIEINAHVVKKANVINWENAVAKKCDCKVIKNEDCIHLYFSGKDWSVDLIVGSLTFQHGSTYLMDDEDFPI